MAVYVHHSKKGPDFGWDLGKVAGLLAQVRYRQGRFMGRMEAMGVEFQAEAQERVRALDMEIFKGPGGRDFTQMLSEITHDYVVPLTWERILRWGGNESQLVKLMHWVNSEANIDPVVKAAVAYLWVVHGQATSDTGDRLADIVMEILMARANQNGARFYSVAGQMQAERQDYDELMRTMRKVPSDGTPWIEWFLGCVGRAIDNSNEALGVILQKDRFWDRCSGMALNDRQRMVLGKLLDGQESKLTSSQWAMLTNTSQDTAGRDINELVRRGVLTRRAGGGRSTSYAINPGF